MRLHRVDVARQRVQRATLLCSRCQRLAVDKVQCVRLHNELTMADTLMSCALAACMKLTQLPQQKTQHQQAGPAQGIVLLRKMSWLLLVMSRHCQQRSGSVCRWTLLDSEHSAGPMMTISTAAVAVACAQDSNLVLDTAVWCLHRLCIAYFALLPNSGCAVGGLLPDCAAACCCVLCTACKLLLFYMGVTVIGSSCGACGLNPGCKTPPET